MSWNRTGFAILLNAALIIRTGSLNHQVLLVGVGSLLLMLALLVAGYGKCRQRELAGGLHRSPAIAIVATSAVAVVTCTAGVVAIVLG